MCLDRDQIDTCGSAADHFGSPTGLGLAAANLAAKPKRSNLVLRNRIIWGMSVDKSQRMALLGIQEALLSINQRQDRLSILQIGACDGKKFDPIYGIVRRHANWTGVFLEPIVEHFLTLMENYGFLSCPLFVNAAVSDFDGSIEIRYVDVEALSRGDVPEWSIGISTIEKGKNAIDGVMISEADYKRIVPNIRTRTVPAICINTLLKIKQCVETDVYVSDCEGHDARILIAMDMSIYRPRIIYCESMLMSEQEKRILYNKLAQIGYIVTDDGVDLLAILESD